LKQDSEGGIKMIYIILAVALGLALASFIKVIEYEDRIRKLEEKMKWWF
jgi:uncharacterized membrane protein YwzB